MTMQREALEEVLNAPGCQRLKDYYAVGPVQKATIESFVDAVCAALADKAIQQAVDRFLGWKLPKDFKPDSFISFDGDKHDRWGGYPTSWPTGTNLFTADQAKVMFEHCFLMQQRKKNDQTARST